MSAFVRFDSLGLGDFFVAAGRVYEIADNQERVRRVVNGHWLLSGVFDPFDLVVPLKVHVEFVHPPIPIRCEDWQATLDSYDGAPDAGHQPRGSGATRREAVIDLAQDIEDWVADEEA